MSDRDPGLHLPISTPRGSEATGLTHDLVTFLAEEGIEGVPLINESREGLSPDTEFDWQEVFDDPDRATPGFVIVNAGHFGNPEAALGVDDGVIAHIEAAIEAGRSPEGSILRPIVVFTLGHAFKERPEPEVSSLGTPTEEVVRGDHVKIIDVTDDPGRIKRVMMGEDE